MTTEDFFAFPSATGIPVAGTIVVTADGLMATFTPTAPLLPSTVYNVEATSGITDLEDQGLSFLFFSDVFIPHRRVIANVIT
jgi:hypothetical protein